MGRKISTYRRDNTVRGTDTVVGSDTDNGSATSTYSMADLAAFFSESAQENIFPDLTDDYLYVNDGNSFVESFIRNEVALTPFSNAYLAVDGLDLTKAIYFTENNVITVGSNVIGVFENPALIAGARIIFFNIDGSIRIFSTIENVNSVSRTIRITDSVTDISSIDGTTKDEGSNRLTVVTNNGITLEGDVTIEDLQVNHITNQNPLFPTSDVSFWLGTEAQFQALVASGDVDSSTVYYRL